MHPNDEYLYPVADRIAPAIMDFAKKHVGNTFFCEDLRRYVGMSVGIAAPASADRVLRHLRQEGKLHYTVVSRSKSLYQINWVKHG